MRILFTGFTARTTGSERLQYDYMSNVFVLQEALRQLGHEVDVRTVSLVTDPMIHEEYDVAVVGIAACAGMASRFKLGAMWTLHKFGKRAGLFPSDGKNVGIFGNSVNTALNGKHQDGRSSYQYFLHGAFEKGENCVLDAMQAEHPDVEAAFTNVLSRLPWNSKNPKCDWLMLVPTHSWGSKLAYERAFGTKITTWDPTHIAIPMQFHKDTLAPDGRLIDVHTALANANERKRQWVVTSLQDQSAWIKKQNCAWPVITVGNKRAARKGEGDGYIPERQMIDEYYLPNWGHLAFGYPLADGGWWRMRYVHAAMAGIVTCCDPADARKMPNSYQYGRAILERMSDERLVDVAATQHKELMASACSVDETLANVKSFLDQLK